MLQARAVDMLRKEKSRGRRKEQRPSSTSFKSSVAVSFLFASKWTMNGHMIPRKIFFPGNREEAGEKDPFLPSSSLPILCQDGMFGAASSHFATMRQQPKVNIYCRHVEKVCILDNMAEAMNQLQDHLPLVFLLSK